MLGVSEGKYKDIRLGPRFFLGQKGGCGGRTNGPLLLTRPQGTHCKDLLSAKPTDLLLCHFLICSVSLFLSPDLFDLPKKLLCPLATLQLNFAA